MVIESHDRWFCSHYGVHHCDVIMCNTMWVELKACMPNITHCEFSTSYIYPLPDDLYLFYIIATHKYMHTIEQNKINNVMQSFLYTYHTLIILWSRTGQVSEYRHKKIAAFTQPFTSRSQVFLTFKHTQKLLFLITQKI